MALTFRGQSNRLNNIESKQNESGFQEKSDPGPRQGIGGQEVSLNQAKAKFAARSGSPLKIKKNFYGGEAYFQDGYSGDIASAAKSSPITQNAKSSPFKINNTLVQGATKTGKKFVDVGAEVGKAFKKPSPASGPTEPNVVDVEDKEKDKTPPLTGDSITGDFDDK